MPSCVLCMHCMQHTTLHCIVLNVQLSNFWRATKCMELTFVRVFCISCHSSERLLVKGLRPCMFVNWSKHAFSESLMRKGKSHLLRKMSRQDVLTDGLLSQRKPELTGLQSHVLIRVLWALQHVLHKQSTSSASLTAQDLHHFWVIKSSPQRYCACEGWVCPLAPPAAWPEPCTRSCAPPSPHLWPAQTDSRITGQEENRSKQCNYI